ncbi:MAG TPA: hypothetical protein VMX17_05125 [Candidatus Glassbacteria bacterium]|nr:hypothetical protein [Candidatus Glassbacteria bacterium]
METENDTVQEDVNVGDQEIIHEQEHEEVQEKAEQQVPLSALQKERRKRQEAESRAKLFEEMQAKQLRDTQKPIENDDDQYEPVTRSQLKQDRHETLEKVEEKFRASREQNWADENPEKIQDLQERLDDFLETRKHLVSAINGSPNRLKESWTLMNALSPKQKAALFKQNVKKDAPGAPGSVPKAANINQAIDVMSMSDSEFNTWRRDRKKRV